MALTSDKLKEVRDATSGLSKTIKAEEKKENIFVGIAAQVRLG